jgi:uridylate kinase
MPGSTSPRYLLKLSGEAFGPAGGHGVDPDALQFIAREIADAHATGAQIAVVVGGGNIIRGSRLSQGGPIHRATADYMGMLGTVINALALREALQAIGVDSRVASAIDIRSVAEPFIRGRAVRHLEKGRVVVLAAGTGNPYFSTDTCAALRATELECAALLKATTVDGVYTADPRSDPGAKRYERLGYDEAIARDLKVMDMTAFALCRENRIPIVVFEYRRPGNIRRAVLRERIGTLVEPSPAGA